MPLENVTYISDLVPTNPVNATDQVAQGDDHIRNIKAALLATFPNVTGAMTASHTELNILDGATLSTAELNLLDGVTASTAELNILDGVTLSAAQINDAARKGVANTFTGNTNTFSGASPTHLFLENDQVEDEQLWRVGVNSKLLFIGTRNDANNAGVNGIQMTRGTGTALTEIEFNATALDINGNIDVSGTLTTPNSSAAEVGFKGVPRVSKTADHTIVAADAGTELVLSSAADDITVQASGAPPEGSLVFLENNTGGSVDIVEGSGITLTLDGTSSTGSRTLAANGRAYIRFTSSSTARVGGIGVA